MFVRNCWYVAAWDHELADQPIPRVIIGEPLVLYRDAEGAPIALQDRCCHRLTPLSKGRIEDGCNLRCMYHGFKFNRAGTCIEIPGEERIPARARVRAFPVVERHSWLWVWMGDPAQADPDLIPGAVGLTEPKWTLRSSQMDYEAHYELINDNLTDFSHLSYVHANSFGATEAFARTRPKIERLPRGIRVTRWVTKGFSANAPLSKQRTHLTGDLAIWQTYDFLAPGILLMLAETHPLAVMPEDGFTPPTTPPLDANFTSQAVTPMTEGTSRYYFSWGPLAGENSAAKADQMLQVALQAFAEDREIIEAQQRIITLKPGTQVLTTADIGPMQMRGIIRELAQSENNTSAA